MNAPITQTNIQKRVSQYIQLRDKLKEMDEEHKKKTAPYREALEQLGNVLLQALNDINSESIRTEAGTVYRTTKKSASIADVTAFWDWVIANQQWDMVDKRANVTAVEDYVAEHGQLPPGLNFSMKHTVGVRRS